MKIYMDICCFNRPFDDQSQLRIKLESEAKLMIQDGIRSGRFELAWSYVLDFENENNPFEERKAQIEKWKLLSIMDTEETVDVLNHAKDLAHLGIKKLDALHVSCAIFSGCDFFITTDDKVLKKNPLVKGIEIVDPFSFIKETEN
ncbi:MAG: hypothetical protein ACLFRG_08855 [Desulfococcaceae bacterium]